MFDPIILQKIDSINRCVARIEQKRPGTLQLLQNDIDLQDIITVNLERAVQQCVDIAMIVLSYRELPVPSTMSEAFDELQQLGIITESICGNMKSAVGFRNAVVHAYRKIDWSIVWDIISGRLTDFKDFAGQILNSK